MLALFALIGGVGLGALAVWAGARSRLERESKKVLALEAAVDKTEAALGHADKRLALRGEQLEQTTKQRDDYAAIASSRELPPPKWHGGQWIRKVWKDRRYNGHPSQNLASLRRDFADFKTEHVQVRLDIDLLGGWKTVLGGSHERVAGQVTKPLSAGAGLLFEGPAPRVLEQMSTFLQDDDTGFMRVDEAGEKTWRDPDSPMTWRLTVDVLEGYETPEVRVVEVIKVQREIEERIVERPVVRTVPPEVTHELCGHTPEQIVALIEAVLEVRELGRDERLNRQIRALEAAPPE